MVDTDDTQRMTTDGQHHGYDKLPTGELKKYTVLMLTA